MTKAKGLLAMTLVVMAFLISCTARKDKTLEARNAEKPSSVERETQAVPAESPSDGVKRVTVEELQAALARGEALVLDVRNEAQYRAGHIAGAKWIPYTEVGERAPRLLPRDKLIVTYCS
ncbi:MAG: hypothetical protein C4334_08885 [Pyrinomonas sp.]|uniref:rhodanese-like domain-containing protein n=1 Tax=Pyrinomonas sp. TaxID=2080306 RepID=UPI003320D8CF